MNNQPFNYISGTPKINHPHHTKPFYSNVFILGFPHKVSMVRSDPLQNSNKKQSDMSLCICQDISISVYPRISLPLVLKKQKLKGGENTVWHHGLKGLYGQVRITVMNLVRSSGFHVMGITGQQDSCCRRARSARFIQLPDLHIFLRLFCKEIADVKIELGTSPVHM